MVLSEIRRALVFQINCDDIGCLLVDKLGLAWSPHSPFASALEGYKKGSRTPCREIMEITGQPLLPQVASALAEPKILMSHRTGGGATPVVYFDACLSNEAAGDVVAVVSPSFGGSLLIQAFAGLEDYLSWWVETLAGKIVESPVNYIPEPVSLESMVYLLHSIDAFRRASFGSLLRYEPTEEPCITVTEFMDSLTRAISNKDYRWLLPSFLLLVPNLNSYGFTPRPEDMDILVDRNFIIPEVRDGTGDVFRFSDPAKAMGVEFYRSWMSATGFEISVQRAGPVNRAFLAPTAMANHLFELKAGKDGGCIADHQALTTAEVSDRIRDMLNKAMEMKAPETIEVKASGATAPAQTAGFVCPNCSSPTNPGARFCGACGRPLPEEPVRCGECGEIVSPGAKFCGSCGARTGGL